MKNTKENQQMWLQKVKEILEMGGKSERTYQNYRSQLNKFFNAFDEDIEIDKLNESDIANYIQKFIIKKKMCANTSNVAICAIRFFYSICFQKELNKKLLPTAKLRKQLPTILPKNTFIKIINGDTNIEHKCWLLLAFCCGLRVSEIASIKIENIYSRDHKLKVIGKRNKERFTILPDIVIKFLRLYYIENNINRKSGYLFKHRNEHINSKIIISYFIDIKRTYALPKNITFHSLRHSFATYYLMNGGNIITLKSMLGHTSLVSTSIYIHIAQNFNQLEGINYV